MTFVRVMLQSVKSQVDRLVHFGFPQWVSRTETEAHLDLRHRAIQERYNTQVPLKFS